MPPRKSKAAKAAEAAEAAKASEAPKRPQRAAKVGKSDPGAYSAASKYVKDVHLHDYSDGPNTTDFKLTHPLSDNCCRQETTLKGS
jgi:hypothetical protein